ncbi:N(4)-(beta-N-acetylglucosaminyl)-L-asparaginase [Akkermansiaceae bacterium]|jgi:N4-(beta-N-acetylglucosaminyl)-L-asparaginase|nr:N(4)-(beta-N-acetylglucosaminyl)-L-asparaginase [Akkermansiaceae bacterium]MDB4400416.1 N(4)-(beta-N-acetylglucosaminyl)-L-asparaginase [Akkermansiaceae bacterium]MDB4519785.1 N(4)-(beta-N-acetylglucosaminyl)-L-asparaginase [Akkermansiaceae bacterium]
MPSTRRQFLATSSIAIGATAPGLCASDTPNPTRPLIVSTWPFGKASNDEALRVLTKGGSILDAVEHGIKVTESDTKNRSVGISGSPNAAGVVQQDACIMHGPGHQAGSVAAIEGIIHPISAARRVMEKTPHVMLVGDGARMFAIEEGLNSIDVDSSKLHEAWRKERASKKQAVQKRSKGDHDTIALLVLGPDGNIAGGCSTSGWGGKLPGRVGDSPIIGSGLYIDNEVGAAGATGLGENVMRHCASFMVVDFMRQGLHPQEACLRAIHRISRIDPLATEDLAINFVALDKKGRYGAAGTGTGFKYSVTTKSSSVVLQSPGVTSKDIGPEGGNRK